MNGLIHPAARRSNTRHGSMIISALVGTLLLTAGSPSSARAYRCTDTAGNVSYSQSPCPVDQTGDQVRGVGQARIKDASACLYVRNFGTESFDKLKRGTEPGHLVAEYGGPSYIHPLTLNVINFASGFRFNKDVSARQVGSLAYNKCSSGGFGDIRISDLPHEIKPPEEDMMPGAIPGRYPVQSTPMTVQPPVYADSARPLPVDTALQQRCAGYVQRLDDINRAMRRGHSASSGEAMRKERRKYQAMLHDNCR